MGDTIHQWHIQSKNFPLKALAHRVHHILANGGTNDTLLCNFWDGRKWRSVESPDIIKAVQNAAKALKLEKKCLDPDIIGAHSLWTGGSMALKLHREEDTTIMKVGRWCSPTFTQYIHNQIAHLNRDISKKMSMPFPYLNIALIA